MAKLAMKKIEIVALLCDSKNIIERLQRRGVVELTNISDENLVKLNTAASINGFEKNLSLARRAYEAINALYDRNKSPLSLLEGRRVMSTADFAAHIEKTPELLHICNIVMSLSGEISKKKSEISALRTRADLLKPWENLDISPDFSGTTETICFCAVIPDSVTADDIYIKASEFDENLDLHAEVINCQKEYTNVFFMAPREQKTQLEDFASGLNVTYFRHGVKCTPSEEIAACNEKIAELNRDITALEGKISGYGEMLDDIEIFMDFLTMRIDKYKALSNIAVTNNTVVITGYIPEKYALSLANEFEIKYGNIAISFSDPDEDEDVPVLLSNSRFSEPVEGITEMYALPNKRDVDPSSVMSFFYYLFFGMMLSDAGYGLLMTVATWIILKKTSIEGKMRKSITMFRNCGISTLFWGILFGSWFGDLPQVIARNFFGTEIGSLALWFEPMNDPVKLLLFSFALGVCHLFWGLGVNLSILWKEGKRFDAICEVVPIYITILGVAPFGANLLTPVPQQLIRIGSYMAIAGAVLIVLTAGRSSKNIFMRFFGGIYGLYNTATGYLSDILSYSRLLALGLATGSIASVINMMAVMPQNVVIKAVMLIVVGIIGHLANMAINLLGAYVHTDRLQFVELFSKFYEGGGRPFKPLHSDTKYFKFEKENIYD